MVRVPDDETATPEMLSVAHRRLLRVRRQAADAVARVRRRTAGPGVHRRVLRLARRRAARSVSAMTDVTFAVVEVAPEPYAVTPILTARLGIAAVGDDPIHAIALRCQVRIEPMRRGYSDDEAAGLLDLFGPRERWATTMHTFLWLHDHRDGAGVHRRHPGRPAAGMHVRLRGDGLEISARPARRGCAAAYSFSAEQFSARGRGDSLCNRCHGIAKIASSCRYRCGVT